MVSGNKNKSKLFTINDRCFRKFKLRKGFCLQIFLDWFANQKTFSTLIEEMEKEELYKCSQVFFLWSPVFCKLCKLDKRFF